MNRLKPDLHQWQLLAFTSFNFRVENVFRYMGWRGPDARFIEDRPGEYTVRVFRRGVQVRGANLSVAPAGLLVGSGFAGRINHINYRIVLPVKVLGTLDKWDATAWKLRLFTGIS